MGQGETATLKGHAAERRAPSKEIAKATRKNNVRIVTLKPKKRIV